MTLSANLLGDLQGDIGISNDQSVFTDTELERLYTRAEYNQDLTVYYAFRQLLANANKFYDYSAGMTSEKRSQIRSNLKDSVEMWEKESRINDNQVESLGLTEIPYRKKDKPWQTSNKNKKQLNDFYDDWDKWTNS